MEIFPRVVRAAFGVTFLSTAIAGCCEIASKQAANIGLIPNDVQIGQINRDLPALPLTSHGITVDFQPPGFYHSLFDNGEVLIYDPKDVLPGSAFGILIRSDIDSIAHPLYFEAPTFSSHPDARFSEIGMPIVGGKTIAFRWITNGIPMTVLEIYDGVTKTSTITSPETGIDIVGTDYDIAVSKEGRYVVFIAVDRQDPTTRQGNYAYDYQLYSFDTRSRKLTQLTTEKQFYSDPLISESSEWVVVQSRTSEDIKGMHAFHLQTGVQVDLMSLAGLDQSANCNGSAQFVPSNYLPASLQDRTNILAFSCMIDGKYADRYIDFSGNAPVVLKP